MLGVVLGEIGWGSSPFPFLMNFEPLRCFYLSLVGAGEDLESRVPEEHLRHMYTNKQFMSNSRLLTQIYPLVVNPIIPSPFC